MDIQLRGLICSNDDADILRWWGWLDITAPMDIAKALEQAGGDEVTLLVNSQGGNMTAGSEIYSMLRRYQGKTEALVQGLAASSATLAMTGCQVIRSEPGALLCYHNPGLDAGGDWQAHDKVSDELKNAAEAIINVYMTRTKKTRAEVAELLNADKLISPQQALEYSLIDEIVGLSGEALGPVQLTASLGGAMGNYPMVTAQMRDAYQAHVTGRVSKQETAKRARAKLEALAKY